MIEQLANLGLPSKGEIDKSQYQAILEQTGFNIESWNGIVKDQQALNDKIDPEWTTKGNDWYLAIFLETAELLDSIDWKWWKHGSTDWFNMKIEMIDILFFIIARAIETNRSDVLIPLLISHEAANRLQETRVQDETLAIEISDIIRDKFLINVTITKNLIGAMNTWLEAWYKMGLRSEDIFKTYKMKHTLNIFRQDFGYKSGKYIKIWNGVEDNVAAQDIVNTMIDSPTFSTDLYNNLEAEYNDLEIQENKSLEQFIKDDPKWSAFMVQVPEGNRNIMFELAEEFQTYLEK